MKKPGLTIFIVFTLLLSSVACRRNLTEGFPQSVRLQVNIDWSQSGFDLTKSNAENYIHRVSIRFFPSNGSSAFDRYLEGDVNQGIITVPVGEYSVVIFNESVYDVYWDGRIEFANIDNYETFAARLVEYPEPPSFYPAEKEEALIYEPLMLASWSLDYLKISQDMALDQAKAGNKSTKYQKEEAALSGVLMRKLTYQNEITLHTKNLASAQKIQGVVKGKDAAVLMASAKTISQPVSLAFEFNKVSWNDATKTDGCLTGSFLSFGKTTNAIAGEMALYLDVILSNGEKYEFDDPWFDISEYLGDVPADLRINLDLELPEVEEGGVSVGDWEDVVIVLE